MGGNKYFYLIILQFGFDQFVRHVSGMALTMTVLVSWSVGSPLWSGQKYLNY